MAYPTDWPWGVIYVNGEVRHATPVWSDTVQIVKPRPYAYLMGGELHLDSPEHPYVRCSAVSLSDSVLLWIMQGNRVKVGGTWYSLNPPKENQA